MTPVAEWALPILLTLIAYLISLGLYRFCHGHILCHPLLTGSLLVGAVLILLDFPLIDYVDNSGLIHLLLGPATAALALPLYQQFKYVKKQGEHILGSGHGGRVV